jgi:hypothetical protein
VWLIRFVLTNGLPKESNPMGILTVQQGTRFVISSDRSMADAPVNRPPKGKPSGDYQVWTGDTWSLVKTDAMTFGTLDQADEYVKANYRRLSGV